MSTLKRELESLVKQKVRREELETLIKRLYCQYMDDTKYSSKDFEDGNPEIESLYIEIKSFYIYVEFETEHVNMREVSGEKYYHSDGLERFLKALRNITRANIETQNSEIITKENRYIIQIYFSNEYEIEVLE